MAVSGVFGWLNLHSLALHIDLPDEIYDGRDTLVTIRLENKKWAMPAFLIGVKVAGELLDFHLVDRRASDTGSLLLKFHGRGYSSLPEAIIQSRFPINFFIRSRTLRFRGRFVVFPAPRPCRTLADSTAGGTHGETFAQRRGVDGEVVKIRDYTGHDPLKHIHWRISAKHETFKVKDMSSSANQPLILDIGQLPGADLDEALCHGVFLVNRLIRHNRPVGLKGGGLLVPPALSRAHRLRLLTELAVYGKHQDHS